ncbi:MAG: hypothetical protein V1804_02585 [Patescibacteria group bacterium]
MKNNKSKEIAKIILKSLLIAGGISLLMVSQPSPYFVTKVLPKIIKYGLYKIRNKKKDKKRFYDSFRYLRNRGLLEMEYQGKQLYIHLSEEGKNLAKKYQVDDLEIKKPRKWDRKWRILIFDIEEKKKIKREALRGKIIELGFFQLQKSVWIYPYDFQKEIELLRNFFGLTDREIQVITAFEIENDKDARVFFGLK